MKLFGLGKYSEKQIAEDIRNGSNAAVKKLYDESSGYLLALCSRYIADHAAAEDVLQDSFLKILSSIGSFTWKGNGSLKAWMSRITVNEALQYLRKQKKSSFIDYGDRLPDMTDEDDDPEVESVSPEDDTGTPGRLPHNIQPCGFRGKTAQGNSGPAGHHGKHFRFPVPQGQKDSGEENQ